MKPVFEKRVYSAAVITISDKGSVGEREDVSGPTAVAMLEKAGLDVQFTSIIPDERQQISELLIKLADDGIDVVLTSGGTGFGPRDVTPEATEDVIERRATGLSQLMMMESLKITPRAALSRGVSGIRGETLIVNLPGSPKSVKENLAVLLGVLSHGLELIAGDTPH
jgi:molybdopterin adenylyltransferase